VKILTICPEEFVGVSAVFRNMSEVIGSNHMELSKIVKNNEIIENYDLVILGGYHYEYLNILNHIQRPTRALLITSTLGQMELTGDYNFLKPSHEMLNMGIIDYLFLGSETLYKTFKTLYNDKSILYFPYPIHPLKPSGIYKEKVFGMFAPNHPRKNILNQIYAFIISNKDYNLITNIPIYTNYPRIQYVNWLPRKDYLEMIESCRAILNVFYTESLCYTTIEAMSLGTPVIFSPAIKQALKIKDNMFKSLYVENPDNVVEIAEKIKYISSIDEDTYNRISKNCKLYIELLAEKHNKKLRELIKSLT